MPNIGIDLNLKLEQLKNAISLTEKLGKHLEGIQAKNTKININDPYGSPFAPGSRQFGEWWNDRDGSIAAAQARYATVAARQDRVSERLETLKKTAEQTEQEIIAAKKRARVTKFEEDFNKRQDDAIKRFQDQDQDTPSRSSGFSIPWGKAIGFGAAAMGIGGIMGFVGQSRRDFQHDAIVRGRLAGRGVGDQGMYLGYNTTEAKQIAESISQGTGYRGAEATSATRTAIEFSRATGTDAAFGTSLMSVWRDTLNANPENQRKQLILLTQIATNTKDSVERVSRVLNSNYSMVTGMQGGMELNASQRVNIPALTETLWNSLGAMGRSTGMMRTMFNAFNPTGDRMTDMEKLLAMGIDKGTGGWDMVLRIKRMQAEGLTTKEGRDAYRKSMGNRSGDDLTAHLQLWFPTSMGIANTRAGDEARMKIHQMLVGGEFEGNLESNANKISKTLNVDKATALDYSKYLSTDASRIQTQEAIDHQNKIKEGQLQYKAFRDLEKAASELIHGLVSSKFAEKMAKSIGEFSTVTLRFERTVERFFDKFTPESTKRLRTDPRATADILAIAAKYKLNPSQLESLYSGIEATGKGTHFDRKMADELGRNLGTMTHNRPGKFDPRVGTLPEVMGIDGLIMSIGELVTILKRIPFLNASSH